MIEYKRSNVGNNYYLLEIFECPRALIVYAARLANDVVTIENFHLYRNPDAVSICIEGDEKKIMPKLTNADLDFVISKTEFLSLMRLWDSQGVYAIFHQQAQIKFKATELEALPRYHALENFGWTLEIAIPDSASSGWGHLCSPSKTLIDQIESFIIAANTDAKIL